MGQRGGQARGAWALAGGRAAQRRLVALLAVAVAVVGLSGCGTPNHKDRAPQPIHNSPTAADGGSVKVVESGFQGTDPYPGNGETNRALVGIVVENTSKVQTAVLTHLSIEVYDDTGWSIFSPGGSPQPSASVGLPRLQPGQKLGVGVVLLTQEEQSLHRKPVRMTVTVLGDSDWEKPDPASVITVSGVHIDEHADGSAELRYSARIAQPPEWASMGVQGLSLLFRDSAGKLLGGIFLGHWQVPAWHAGPGDYEISFKPDAWLLRVPAGADLSKTEAYGSFEGG
jgi:hypothetical protein